jgi:capsular exopolysaccharide synthesis family protein
MQNSKQASKKSHSWKIIFIFLIAASTLAIKINYFSPKQFQSIAQIKLRDKIGDNHPGLIHMLMAHPFTLISFYDAALRNAVMDATKNKELNVEYFQTQPLSKKELYTAAPIIVSYEIKNANFYKQEFNFKYTYENNFILTYEANGEKKERSGEFGKEIHESDLKFTVNKNSKINGTGEEDLLAKNLVFTIYSNEAFADNLLKSSVDVSSSEGGITSISVTTGIPQKSMLLANGISESLLESSNRVKELETINQELAKVSEELENARLGLSSGIKDNKFTGEMNRSNSYAKSSENIEAQKKYLESQAEILETLSDSLRKNINNNNASIEFGAINDPLIPEYITAINERIARKKYASEIDSAALGEEIAALKNTLADVIRNTRKKIALQQEKIYNLIPQLNQEPSMASSKENNPALQSQNLYLTEKLYNYIVDKRTEMQGLLPFSPYNFIQKATLPRESSNANATIVWTLAIIIGFITGSIATFIFNVMVRLVKTRSKEIETQNPISYFANIEDTSKNDTSTQFQKLCTKMLLLRNEGEKQIITITSDEPAIGKTFVATHLSKSLASLDLNVLLIDMNLINPSIEETFEANATYTLADVLQKKNSIQEAVQITSIPGLDIIIAGELTNGMNSLIATNNITKILNELKGHYDVIIIDAADITSSMDAMPCIKLSNSTLFVVKTGADEKQITDKAEQMKTEYNIENIYFISNNLKHALKQKQKNKSNQTKGNEQGRTKSTTPFMKRAALWSY